MAGPIPHIVVRDANAAIEFYKKAFGATEVMRYPAPDGKRLYHAQLTVMGGTLFLCDDFPEHCGGTSNAPSPNGPASTTLHLGIDKDIDPAFQRAIDAGATVVMPLDNQFWGDRYGSFRDPFGHTWSMGMPLTKE